MAVKIRPALADDAAALSRICLLTADSGQPAEHLHDFPELPGLVWANPYVQLPTTWGFVMEEESSKEVVGYIVGSKDTPTYEKYTAENLWPGLAARYPPSLMVKPADRHYANLLQKFRVLPDSTLAFSPAHLHIDILPSHQKQGWGQRLIQTAVEHLKGEGIDGVWLVMNPQNRNASKFYEKLGFQSIAGSPKNHVGLRFESWAC
ncbi:acyl-CoA N-acyltransferase [Mycena belliarum]|uniref:Acyl-CoA N-acyltransferase n=1 Tax=Mycena belliarum TaxID=1033014 RepID=A0AAD6XYW1_9AGAR|nr:acyl-CoA N-acyltransferase [Mycena belliae]